MCAVDVVEILDRLDAAGVETWLDGGWAVDALLGEQTRPHADLDLIVRIDQLAALRDALGRDGFAEVPGGRDSNFVLRDALGREIDIHAMRLDGAGDGIYPMASGEDWVFPGSGFVGRGSIEGRVVHCLTAEVQMLCHAHGYVPGETDLHDMRLLNSRLGTPLLSPYGIDVRLRDVEDDDLPILFEYQADPVATEMADFPARDREAYLAHSARIRADPTVTFQTILVDGQVAGNVVAWDDAGRRSVGYWIGREFWGRGVATLALAAFLRIVTTRPLYAHVAKHNLGSIRVLEKCGFRIIAEARPEPGDEVEELVLRLELKA